MRVASSLFFIFTQKNRIFPRAPCSRLLRRSHGSELDPTASPSYRGRGTGTQLHLITLGKLKPSLGAGCKATLSSSSS